MNALPFVTHPQRRWSGRHPWLAVWLAAACLGGMPLAGRAAPSPAISYFRGACDASTAIPIGTDHQVVADDEDNILRVYHRAEGGMPLWSLDLSGFLQVDPRDPEVDVEAGARIGDRIYWISSHGRNRKGALRPGRHRFFATSIRPGPGFPRVEPVGVPSTRLLADLLADRRLSGFDLARAAALPPKFPGGLNIEGMTALPDGRLLIGFRNPQPQGRALLVPLENPADVVSGRSARFGDPILLDLDHRGIRGLGTMGDRVLIAAGAHDDAPRARLFEWRVGSPAVQPIADPALGGLNLEGVEAFDSTDSVAWLVVSDDGTAKVDGRDCKRLKVAALKRFRSAVLVP